MKKSDITIFGLVPYSPGTYALSSREKESEWERERERERGRGG